MGFLNKLCKFCFDDDNDDDDDDDDDDNDNEEEELFLSWLIPS